MRRFKKPFQITIIEEYNHMLGYRRGWHLWIDGIKYFIDGDVYDNKNDILDKINEMFDKKYKENK